jgi:hypothetical protein
VGYLDASLTRPGEVAQLVEHTTENRGVAGSIPALAIASGTRRSSGCRSRLGSTPGSTPRQDCAADRGYRVATSVAKTAVPAHRSDSNELRTVHDQRGASIWTRVAIIRPDDRRDDALAVLLPLVGQPVEVHVLAAGDVPSVVANR